MAVKSCFPACLISVFLLSACDGTLNLNNESAITSMSNGDAFRGLALAREQIAEDSTTSGKRRDMYELMATKMGVAADKNFIKTLEANPHFSNIELKSQEVKLGREAVNIVRVNFIVDNAATVALTFWVQSLRVLGPLHLNRLPHLESAEIQINGQPSSFRKSPTDILLAAVGSDKNMLSKILKSISRKKQIN